MIKFTAGLVAALLSFFLLLDHHKQLQFKIFNEGYQKGYDDAYNVAKAHYELSNKELASECMFFDYDGIKWNETDCSSH